MAYVAQDEEEEKRQASPVGAAPAPGNPAGNMGTGANAPQNAGAPRGSGFVNFQSYLEANDASGMADKVASGVEADANDARGAIDRAGLDFGSAVAAGTNTYGRQSTSTGAREAAGRSYSGPTSLAAQPGFEGAATKAAGAASKANALGTSSGRNVLLQDTYGANAGYSPGGRALDSALLGAQGGARLGQAQRGVGDLRAYLGQAETKATGAVASAQGESAEAQAQYGRDADSLAKQESFRSARDTAAKDAMPSVRERYDRWEVYNRDVLARLKPESRKAFVDSKLGAGTYDAIYNSKRP